MNRNSSNAAECYSTEAVAEQKNHQTDMLHPSLCMNIFWVGRESGGTVILLSITVEWGGRWGSDGDGYGGDLKL